MICMSQMHIDAIFLLAVCKLWIQNTKKAHHAKSKYIHKGSKQGPSTKTQQPVSDQSQSTRPSTKTQQPVSDQSQSTKYSAKPTSTETAEDLFQRIQTAEPSTKTQQPVSDQSQSTKPSQKLTITKKAITDQSQFKELSSIDVNHMADVTIKVKITSKTLKNVSTGTILEMDLCDGTSFCRCIAWNNLASFFNSKLSLNNTYIMSGISARKIKPQFQRQGALPIEVTLSAGVNIKACDDDIDTPDTPYCTIDTLNQVLSKRVNVIGIVKSYDKSATPQVTQQGKTVMKREFTIADDTQKEATATLWGDHATSFNLEGNPVVEITNSTVKSYKNKASISVTSIKEDKTSPKSKMLKAWFQQNPCTTPVSTAKRRLDVGDYKTVDISQLSSIAVGEEVQVLTEIENAQCEMYVACKICRTGIITVLDEEYCPKCNKTTDTLKRVVLNIKLKDFSEDAKLFQDNIGCLISANIDELESKDVLEAIRPLHDKPAYFLILKRSKNTFIDFVILDVDFGASTKYWRL